jgi:hypothetical protein
MALTHYVSFYYPGFFFGEESVKKIKNREVKIDIPEGAFAYQFWDQEETKSGNETLRGNRKNYSGYYYPQGTVYTLAQVKEKFPQETMLISNMELNKYKKVVETRRGNWQPFDPKKDKIV